MEVGDGAGQFEVADENYYAEMRYVKHHLYIYLIILSLFDFPRQKILDYRDQLVAEGRLLEAEEEQAKLEDLKDQEYNELRNNILTRNDIEINELIAQRDEQLGKFMQAWDE